MGSALIRSQPMLQEVPLVVIENIVPAVDEAACEP
jgi:hypothetical protein